MERSIKGDVVVIPFPISDLSSNKRRPALVIQTVDKSQALLCMITSREDDDSIKIEDGDFADGSLPKSPSFVRPLRLFTADMNKIINRKGEINILKTREVIDFLVKFIEDGKE